MKNRSTMSEGEAIDDGYGHDDDAHFDDGHGDDGRFDVGHGDADISCEVSDALDTEDLETLGYGHSTTEVFGAVTDVRDRVFGADFVDVYVAESLVSPDGGVVVDDVNASELVLDDGRGNPNFRSLGRSSMPAGFHVLTEGALRSWSKAAPKPTPRSGAAPVKSIDLNDLLKKRMKRDAARTAVYLRDGFVY